VTEKVRFNRAITVGGQPLAKELRRLKQQGFKSIINLRTNAEQDRSLKPDEEGELVKSLGMDYINLPVALDSLQNVKVDAFRDALDKLPEPIFVHCSSGKRAGAFTMMDAAVKEDISGNEVVEMAEQMGFECDVPELESFVKAYIDTHDA
jgi:uncharacterized protein (TIGR01244 family)